MIVVVVGGIVLGIVVITLVSALSPDVPKAGQEEIGGIEMDAELFFTQVETMIHRLGMVIEAVERGDGDQSILFQAVDPTPVRGARILVLARADAPGTPVGLEEVNKFGDSIRGHEAVKGVMITTAGFLPDAGSGETAYRLELIDGERFLDLVAEVSSGASWGPAQGGAG